jgi:O-antigen/teichoic acid export membrane protein
VYTLTRFVADALSNVLVNPLSGVQPGLGQLIGGGEFARAVRARNEYMAFNWLVLTAAGVAIILWDRSFVGLWVGHKYFSGELTAVLVVLLTAQFVLIRNDSYIIDLTLNVRRKVLLGVLSTALAFAAAAIFVKAFHMGIPGAALGFLVGRSIMTVAYPHLIGKALGHSLGEQLRGSIRCIAATAALFTVAILLAPHVVANGWVRLIVKTGVTVALVAPLAAWIGLNGLQRKRLWKRVARLARGVRRSPLT